MTASVDISESMASPKGSHGRKPRERKDIASGQSMPPERLLRIAFGPEGIVVPDPSAKLPGRGAWIVPKREAIETAIKAGAFARAAKAKVNVPERFADHIETALALRVLGLLGMANKAGALEFGFDKVRACASTGKLAFRFEAKDGAPDGRGKIRVIAKAVAKELGEETPPAIGCFEGEQLGQVVGREHMVHIGLKRGRLAQNMRQELIRLSGFRSLVPEDWPDKAHEEVFPAFGEE